MPSGASASALKKAGTTDASASPAIAGEGDKLVVYEPEAKIVRYIYKRYMQGASRVGIAKELNEEHITTANGAKWADSNVKCIYIDPPYNTGNEGWVYNDNVNDPRIKKWLGEVVGKEGEDLTRHDKWLCMMYPRLKLLQKLLANDGVIFISIDDTEYANLKLICDEIFGIRNFLADVIWEKSDSPRMDAKIFSARHDHTITYSKNIDALYLHRIHTNEIPEHFNKVESDGRRYYLKPLRAMGQNDAREARPNLYYAMNQIKAIFQDGKTFDTPKPVGLVERMLEIASDKDSVILDSFGYC